tara:strand:- start:246 stop:452 length:207 start_codon:yes stop_codon:yes gene_type:complete
MKARLIGVLVGVLAGAVIGGGTGIVGGPFGAVAGASIFMIGGGLWGFSAGPDVARQIDKWRSRKGADQ